MGQKTLVNEILNYVENKYRFGNTLEIKVHLEGKIM